MSKMSELDCIVSDGVAMLEDDYLLDTVMQHLETMHGMDAHVTDYVADYLRQYIKDNNINQSY